jgi:hypothetical protein
MEEKAEFILRAKCNRGSEVIDVEYSYLWKKLLFRPRVGKSSILISRNGKKSTRTAYLSIHVTEIFLCGRKGQAQTL